MTEFSLERKATETARNINQFFGQESIPDHSAQRRCQSFRGGNKMLKDNERPERKLFLDDETLNFPRIS